MFPANSPITFHPNKEIFSLQWLTVDYRDLFTMATLMDNRLRSVLSLYSDVLVELHSKENPQKQHVRRTENGPTPCRSAGVSCFSSSFYIAAVYGTNYPGKTVAETSLSLVYRMKTARIKLLVMELLVIKNCFL